MHKSLFCLVFCLTLPVVADTFIPAVRYFVQDGRNPRPDIQNGTEINKNESRTTTPKDEHAKFNSSKMDNSSTTSLRTKSIYSSSSSTSSLTGVWRDTTEPWNHTSTTNSPHTAGQKNPAFAGAIAGIVIGCLVLIGLGIALAVYLRKKYRVRKYRKGIQRAFAPEPDIGDEMEWDDMGATTIYDDTRDDYVVEF